MGCCNNGFGGGWLSVDHHFDHHPLLLRRRREQWSWQWAAAITAWRLRLQQRLLLRSKRLRCGA